MEKISTIRIILNDYLVKESVELILRKALESDCKFYSVEDNMPLEEQNTKLPSPEIASQTILKMEEKTNQGGTILVKVQEAEMLLSFISKHPKLSVEITPFSNHWGKKFLNGKYQIDLARYISLLLAITQDFPIINIEIRR